jgi:hypothetical protein
MQKKHLKNSTSIPENNSQQNKKGMLSTKGIYEKPKTYSILKKHRMIVPEHHKCLLLAFLLNFVLRILASASRQEKKKKARLEKVKGSLFTNDMTTYVENPMES